MVVAGAAPGRTATPIDWDGYAPPAPRQPGIHVLEDYDLAELRDYIDWQPFFNAWEMKGKFPDILNNPTTGETARALYDDAQAMLDRIIEEKWLHRQRASSASSRPTRSATTSRSTPTSRRTEVLTTLHHLRQQGEHREGVPNRSLADFVAPTRDRAARPRRARSRSRPGSGAQDRITAFKDEPTTTPRSCWSRWPTGSPRPSPSGCTSGCARSSGATCADEDLDNEDLIAEKYHGHPAGAGLPRLPRAHREADAVGAARRARRPPASSSPRAWPCGRARRCRAGTSRHPQSQYFVVGRLGRDQVADYAERKGWTLAEAERWLSPNLGYDPED